MPCRWYIDVCSTEWLGGWVDDDGPVDLIEISVNGRRIAALSPTNYRKDLEDAGFGDGRRGFGFAISPYLVEPSNVVTVTRGAQVLHSATLHPPGAQPLVAPGPITATHSSAQPSNIMLMQTADLVEYKPILDITSRTVKEYCGRHGYSYHYFLGLCRGYRPWQATFNRIPLLRNIARNGFTGWVCYLDADAFIADLDFDLADYLRDKSQIAFIAASDRPHLAGRPYWLVNAGAFLVNLGTSVGRKIVRDWGERFDRITDQQLQAMVEWTFDDQPILQQILHEIPNGSESILTLGGEPNLINYHSGTFIRQILREHGNLQERIELLRSETDRILGTSSKQVGSTASVGSVPAPATRTVNSVGRTEDPSSPLLPDGATRAGNVARTNPQLGAGKIAIITMAYNESVNLPIWVRHYRRTAPGATLFVIDHGSDDGSTSNLLGVSKIPLPRSKLDEDDRLSLVNSFQQGLLRYYDVVIYVDCDELLLPNPAKSVTLEAHLSESSYPYASPIGINVIHIVDSEPPIDLAQPLFVQRRYAQFHSSMCKPLVTRVPLNWGPGFHTCERRFGIDRDLYLFHIKQIDRDQALQRQHLSRKLAWSNDVIERNHWAHHRYDDERFLREFFLEPAERLRAQGVQRFVFDAEITRFEQEMTEVSGFFQVAEFKGPIVEIPPTFRAAF